MVVKCFLYTATADGNITVAVKDPYLDCSATINTGITNRGKNNGLLLLNGNAKIHQFGGSRAKL